MSDLPPPTPYAEEPPPLPVATPGSSTLWLIAFLFFPFGTIIYMAVLRVVSFAMAVFLLFVSIAVTLGLASIMAQTHNERWQMCVTLFIGVSVYALGLLQFILGEKARIWSPRALRIWRSLAWVCGVLLLVDILCLILLFHMSAAGLLPPQPLF